MLSPRKVVCLALLLFMATTFYMISSLSYGTDEPNIADLESRVDRITEQPESNGREIEKMNRDMRQMEGELDKPENVEETPEEATSLLPVMVPVKCDMNHSLPRSDVQMLDVYETLAFDNPDGGVWKQGWDIVYQPGKVAKQRKLQVIVVPHSHCDPGWIKTFEEYYQQQTSSILDKMVKHLGEKKEMRFIFAEMSFFEKWWREQSEETRHKVKEYLQEGRFEIVTGGWVMADEANSHYFSIIAELFEGHEWLKNELDYRPRSHWSIDPFGLSPSLPLLLSAANITNAALQRIHYSVKKHLARNKQLEFTWRQLWDQRGSSDMRTHVFPFYSYDVPHTCGPEPALCCQFDFNCLPGGADSCPWGTPAVPIGDGNVAEKAFSLYDQYRKKSQLYDTNVLLVPLGDDFRYRSDFEWNGQYTNYQKLFKHMNAQKKWNVKARFGTLSDYFGLLEKELAVLEKNLPVLTGDFFTYADRDDHYWSGYFTSRPFYKQMDRVLQHHLRSADILFSLASMSGFGGSKVFESLVKARRLHSLFQHHDGVTGTAKDHVVIDYGQKMLEAMTACEGVLSESLGHLLGRAGGLQLDAFRPQHDVLPTRRIFSRDSVLVVFNPLEQIRKKPICIVVDSDILKIGREVEQEISPVFTVREGKIEVVPGQFELCFVHPIGPLSAETFHLVEGDVELAAVASNEKIGNYKTSSISGDLVLSNEHLQVKFNGTSGFVHSMKVPGEEEVLTNLHFVHYGVRSHTKVRSGGGDDLSGAYLFLPDGPASPLAVLKHHIVVIDGKLMKRVLVAGHKEVGLFHKTTLASGSTSVEIEAQVDIRSMSNYELAMRLSSSLQSGDDIYTDLNGLQMIRRRRMLDKLPLQAHFYPMPGSAYIQDQRTRLNVLGAQALGVASLESGQLEVMLDRRLAQDDGRGLFQGVEDNKRTVSRFRLLVEPLSGSSDNPNARSGFLSSAAHSVSRHLLYPWINMKSNGSQFVSNLTVSGLTGSLPCDHHIVNIRTLGNPLNSTSPLREAALILHRPLTDCRSKLAPECPDASSLNVRLLLPMVKSVRAGSLTLLYENTTSVEEVAVEPQEVRTLKISW